MSSPLQMEETEQDFVEILEVGALDIKKYTDFVRSPSAGAIATFIGTTRDTFEDKRVLELRYEAYVPMALRQMNFICSEARRQYNLLKLAVVHRLGVVPVGEESVFVAASSVHRKDALGACEFIIDEIKASVPIWKKEVYTNGEVWKENSEFFLRKAGNNNKEELNIKKNKISNHSMCCGHKERTAEKVIVDNGHLEDGFAGQTRGGSEELNKEKGNIVE
eukprot:TRINITY_DN40271_c0_g1_i1.p1 TRINITY_DN40271_c0_g1~~TRINITY_DN40271_c0_g1_i1.p1  ORF type:complete len:220 (-),score=51.58 TRINITY_DN40271_c0_g1_i1:130-789(-)